MSRQRILYHERVRLCRDKVWPWMGFLCRDIVLLCCDRTFQDMGFPCRDIAFSVTTIGHGVALQQGRACARQIRSVAHDRPWTRATVWRCVAS